MRILRIAYFTLLAQAAMLWASTNETDKLFFGFAGPETYPIDSFIAQLKAADIDGDGLTDLVVVNNSRSKINVLLNQTGKTNRVEPPAFKRELNELPPDSRFRIVSIASEKRIAGFVVDDLNGDKRPDIAYYGEPKELVVQYNEGSNTWSTPKRWPIEEGQLTINALTAGDLNGDGLNDLLLLGENQIYSFFQGKDHTLAEPEKIAYSGAVKSIQVLDINGDERHDLLLVNWENANPFRFRLQNQAGQLGPEIHFGLAPIRSYIADDLDGDSKTEVITIALQSGRAQISNFIKKPAQSLMADFKQGQFQVMPLTKTTKARRASAWEDINGDGFPDLLVAEPETGQLNVFLQQQDGSISAAKSYPTFTGVTELAVIPPQGTNLAQIFLMSPDERQIGVTEYDKGGRVAFPKVIPTDGKPLAMALGPMEAKAKPSLAVIVDQDGKRTLLLRTADGERRNIKLAEAFKSNPSSLTVHDADQDGRPDLVALIPYEKIKVLRQLDDMEFEEHDVSAPGGTLEQPWLSIADVDGDKKPELLFPQKSFMRAVVLKADAGEKASTNTAWGFAVKDQINGAGGNSRIVGAAPLRGTNNVASLFLLDAERKALTVCDRDTNGVWQVVRNVLLPFTEFSDVIPLALGSKQPNSIGFRGLNAVGWLPLRGDTWEFSELDGYETPIKDGHLHDVVSGDLNQNKRKDLVFLETGKNYLDLVVFNESSKLVPAARWQVFEERTFRGRRGDQPEPREALIVDVTGDKRNDLVVIVHDRILVYPQE